jgi:predicted transcriptional regulator of viral defense system
MNTIPNSNLRTSRSRMASLLVALYDSGRTMFTTAEAARMTGLTVPLASSLLHKARKRGLVSQLKRGLFVIVPPELESSAEYAGNPYLTLVSSFGRWSSCPGFWVSLEPNAV